MNVQLRESKFNKQQVNVFFVVFGFLFFFSFPDINFKRRQKKGWSKNARPLCFDWQCHICKRVMNHKTRVKGKLTQQLTGDWYTELEVFNLAAELTWSLYNKLQCLKGNTSPDGLQLFCLLRFSAQERPSDFVGNKLDAWSVHITKIIKNLKIFQLTSEVFFLNNNFFLRKQ